MSKFIDYSIFVTNAYLISGVFLTIFAALCYFQLKKNELKLKKIELKKKTKN
ncbi:MAG: hypothetical protein ACJAW3_001555 [Lentimonas sp.]|jgi:hypothetical protein